MRTKSIPILLSLVILSMLSACRKNMDLASWDVDVISPLAKGQLSLGNLINSDDLDPDNNGLYHLITRDTLFRIGLDTLIGIPDTTISNEFVVPIGNITFPPGVVFYRDTNRIKYKLKDVGLTYAEIRESLITVELNNTIDEKVLLRYSILSATQNGDTFRVEELIEPNAKFEADYDLDDHVIDFTGLDGDQVNTLITTIEVMIDPNAPGPHTFSAGDKVGIDLVFKKIIPEYAKGYFGQQRTLYSDSTIVDLFPDIDFDFIDIAEFNVKMTVDNGVGADLQLSLDRIGSFNSIKNSAVDLEHEVVGSKLQFGRAIDLNPSPEEVKHTIKEFQFNENNSNLDKLLELKPDNLIFDLDLEINPLGNVSLGNDFVYYGHDLSAYLDVDVPLKIGVGGLSLSDTFDFDLGESGPVQFDPLNEGKLMIYLDNQFPVSGQIQLSLIDENGEVLRPLFSDMVSIESGVPSGNGELVNAVQSVIEIPVDQVMIEDLNSTQRIVFDAILETYENSVTNINENASLSFKLIADVNMNTQ